MSIAMNEAAPRPKLQKPSFALLLAEARSIFELNATLLLTPALAQAPRGDGHPVLVLPGFLASDLSTMLLRRFLTSQGFKAHAWEFGRNFGGVYSMRARLREKLTTLYETTGSKVSLVGWSLGGIYSRDLAIKMPEMVRGIVTLGSPFAADINATNASKLYEMLSGERIQDSDPSDLAALAGDMPVPSTSIFSRTDGVVNWRTCLQRETDTAENIEVLLASHIGLGVNAAALWAVADRLAQPDGEFSPFDRSGPFAMAYGVPGKE